MHTTQTFPSLSIEALPSGLFRLEDDHMGDTYSVDIHPAQVQVLATMVGFTMPNKTAKLLNRLADRLKTVTKQARDLERMLGGAIDSGEGVALELTAAEFIAQALDDLISDMGLIQSPDIEVAPGAENAGGQICIPM
jgi:hypothetical protein